MPLTREQVRQLVELAGVLRDEAEACAKDKHWRAATLLAAESVEAGLVATVVCFESELRVGGAWPRRSDPAQAWPLDELLKVARQAGWLSQSLSEMTEPAEALLGEVGDAVRFLKEVRNLAAHPARAITGGQLPGHDFQDDLLMAHVYRLLDGIAAAVFAELSKAVRALPDPP